MSRISMGALVSTFAILTTIGFATPARAGHDLRAQAQELRKQACALVSTVQQGYHSARNFECLLSESAHLERMVDQVSCIVADPRQAHKAELLLRKAERQAESVCDLLSDVNDHCISKSARKRAHRLIHCIEDDIDDLADAVAECSDHHHHARPVFGNVPRQGGWGLFIRR